jgi:RNA polymerase sigma-70 factor (ECF subfamily)
LNELRRRRTADRHRQDLSTRDNEYLRVDPDLWDALGHLKPEHRAAVMLTIVDGYTQVEAAEILSVPPGTVASWVSRAKERLRVELESPDE